MHPFVPFQLLACFETFFTYFTKHLGMPFLMAMKFNQAGPCPACLQHSDCYDDHALCCGHWGERITRHNSIRDHVHQMAAAAVLNPVKEGRFILPGNDRRPADIFLPNWAEGRDAALDVMVINPLQQATVVEAATTPGHSLDFAFDRKMRGAADDCQRQGVAFIPLAFESLGGWHKTAEVQVKRIAQDLARQTGREESERVSKATSRLSLMGSCDDPHFSCTFFSPF